MVIRKKLSAQDENNKELQRDLVVSFVKMYNIHIELNNQSQALVYMEQAYEFLTEMEALGTLAVHDIGYLQQAKEIIEEMKK